MIAQLGFHTFNEMIGRSTGLTCVGPFITGRRAAWTSTPVATPPAPPGVAVYHCESQDHGLDSVRGSSVDCQARPALEEQRPVRMEICGCADSTARLRHAVRVRRWPSATVTRVAGGHRHIHLTGTAGAEFRCFSGARRHTRNWLAKRTTTSARASAAAGSSFTHRE